MYHKQTGIMPRTIGGLIEDFFQNGFNRIMSNDFWNETTQVPVNISENEKSYEMQVVAPGISKEEFKINIDRNVLTVSFEHKEENKEENAGKVLRHEYKTQSFKRSFTLNDKIDTAGISARYDNGVLYLNLPKKESSDPAPQQIAVA